MDLLVWIMRAAGGLFALLTLGLAYSRVSSVTERDVNPVWWLAFIVLGAISAVCLVIDWAFPISVTVMLANGGDAPRQARVGDRTICLPAKSYDDLTWRFSVPDAVFVGGNGAAEQRFAIGKGTWLINTSPVTVTADMYERGGEAVDFDALFAQSTGAIKVSAQYGRPFRMFSQAPIDRVYVADGDVRRRSIDGPCPAAPPAR